MYDLDALSSYDGLVALFAGLAGLLIFVLIIALACFILWIVSLWKVYKKAGKGGWEALIPFYSTWVRIEISGLAWWFIFIILASTIAAWFAPALSMLAGIAGIAGSFFCNYNLAKKFGKDPVGFGIGLTLLSVIFMAILAFSKDAKYDAKVKVSEYGPIEQK